MYSLFFLMLTHIYCVFRSYTMSYTTIEGGNDENGLKRCQTHRLSPR